MNLKRLESRLIKDEGYRAKAYLDSDANPPTWTIGYGSTRWLNRMVEKDDIVLPIDARRLLRADIFGAIIDAQKLFPRFEELNSCRQEVLISMAYQMGYHRLAKFTDLRAASDELDYAKMAEEMVDSKWFRRFKTRAQRLVAAMRTGDWVV
jgi:GH24 family phage-related lysozyme (muramidase)